MPQNIPVGRNIPVGPSFQAEASQKLRLQQLLMQMQEDEARKVAAEAKQAELKAKLADPIEAMNLADQQRRFAQRRDIVPVRGISAAPTEAPVGPMGLPTGRPSLFPQPATIKGVSRITEGPVAQPKLKLKPVTTQFGTSTPRMASEPMTTGGMTEPRLGADVAADPNYAKDYEMRKAEAELDPRVLAAQATGDARITVSQGGMANLTPEGLDLAAHQYALTGQMPPMGMGNAGARSKIINRAAELVPAGAIAGNRAAFDANKSSLTQLQKSRDSIGSFELTAQKNIGILEQTMKRLADTGSPLMNQPIRNWQQKLAGNVDLAEFNAARRVVVNEIAKITTNPNLAGILTDEARKEADALISGDMTVPQMMGAIKILRQDMANRIGSFDDQIADIKGRFPNLGGGPNTSTTTTLTPDELIEKYKTKTPGGR